MHSIIMHYGMSDVLYLIIGYQKEKDRIEQMSGHEGNSEVLSTILWTVGNQWSYLELHVDRQGGGQ